MKQCTRSFATYYGRILLCTKKSSWWWVVFINWEWDKNYFKNNILVEDIRNGGLSPEFLLQDEQIKRLRADIITAACVCIKKALMLLCSIASSKLHAHIPIWIQIWWQMLRKDQIAMTLNAVIDSKPFKSLVAQFLHCVPKTEGAMTICYLKDISSLLAII